MKNRSLLALPVAALVAAVALAQKPEAPASYPAAAARTDLYAVYFVKAAPGKSAELLKSITTPGTDTPMPMHSLVLKHVDGDDWDFVSIEHLGPKVTVDAAPLL